VLVAHSAGRGTKNDDSRVLADITRAVGSKDSVMTVAGDLDARVLRSIIGRAGFAIVSRYHAMVSALACGTPVMVVGWGHKYRETLALFDLESWHLDWHECRAEHLQSMALGLEASESCLRASILQRLPAVLTAASENFELVRRALELRATLKA
jgi:polysaccharide pyruvyl transferase WcaK-like protein